MTATSNALDTVLVRRDSTPVRNGDFPWAWVWLALGGAAGASGLVTFAVWGTTPLAHGAAIDTGIKAAAAVLAVLATFIAVQRLRLSQAQERLHEAEQRVREADQQQREIEHEHRIAVDDDIRRDAAERRVTELLVRAGDLLANEKATTRITGLAALERLGQENPPHRQTVVDVVCAYLQMPFEAPALKEVIPLFESGPTLADESCGADVRQELRVRLTAQRLLANHLRRTGVPERFWPNIDLDLSGATLIDFRLGRCQVAKVEFTYALFVGVTSFEETRFAARALFNGARFTGPAFFNDAVFDDDAHLDAVTFTGYAGAAAVTFARARFRSGAWFSGTEIHGRADFAGVRFYEKTTLAAAKFHEEVELLGAHAAQTRNTWPPGWRIDKQRSGPDELFPLVRT